MDYSVDSNGTMALAQLVPGFYGVEALFIAVVLGTVAQRQLYPERYLPKDAG